MTTLHVGSSGEEVTELQARLLFLGMHPGPLDGHFDATLERSVQHYQKAMGLDPTGGLDDYAFGELRTNTDGQGFSLDQAIGGAYDGHYAAATAVFHEHAPVQEMTADPVPGKAGAWDDQLANSLHHMVDHVLALSATHATAVTNACTAFRWEYAEPRLKDVKFEYTGEDYFKFMGRYFMDESGIWMASLLPTPLKVVFIPFSMAASRAVGSAIKETMSLEGDLRHALDRLIVDVTTNLTVAREKLRDDLNAHLKPIFERLDHGEALDPADEAWVAPFYRADTGEIDALIEQTFGIPVSAVDTELRIFEQLASNFEELITAETGPGNSVFPSRETEAERFVRDREGRERVREAMKARTAKLHPPTQE